jgi:hypothetical protein
MAGEPDSPRRLSQKAEDLIASFRHIASQDPARTRIRPTQDLTGLIESIMVKFQVGRPSLEQTIRDHWAQIVKPVIAQYSHPLRIERGVLWVRVSNSIAREEIFFAKDRFVEQIRLLPGGTEVHSLRVTTG